MFFKQNHFFKQKKYKQNHRFKFNFLSHKVLSFSHNSYSLGASVVKKKINASLCILWNLIDFEPRDSIVKLLYMRCCIAREVLQVASPENRRQDAYRIGVVLPSRETSPSFVASKCLCVLKHIAGVHKVYLGEYIYRRAHATTMRKYNAIDARTASRTREHRQNIIARRRWTGGWRAALLLFFEHPLTLLSNHSW